MIVLPMISAIVAPNAALSQSFVGLLGACDPAVNCSPGLTCTSCVLGRCDGSDICCATPGPNAFGPGQRILICTSSGFCAGAGSGCCSGATSFNPNGRCPTPGDGACDCR